MPPVEQPDGPAAAKVQHAWESLGHPLVLTNRDRARALSAKRVAAIEELGAAPADHNWHHNRAEDLVLLMLTSGSTGAPKAVRLCHNNLLTHTAAARQHHNLTLAILSLSVTTATRSKPMRSSPGLRRVDSTCAECRTTRSALPSTRRPRLPSCPPSPRS